jgi:hypothetical protein
MHGQGVSSIAVSLVSVWARAFWAGKFALACRKVMIIRHERDVRSGELEMSGHCETMGFARSFARAGPRACGL